MHRPAPSLALLLGVALVACARTADRSPDSPIAQRAADSTAARVTIDTAATRTAIDTAVARPVIDSTTTGSSVDGGKTVSSPAQLRVACRAAAARENPKVRWAADTSLSADMNYDGKPELVVWGNQGDSLVVLSIVECSGAPGHVWSMPLEALEMFGSRNLDIELEDPSFDEGYLSESCAGSKSAECLHLYKIDRALEAAYSRGGRGLVVGVEDRDHVHIYWDPDEARFASWHP